MKVTLQALPTRDVAGVVSSVKGLFLMEFLYSLINLNINHGHASNGTIYWKITIPLDITMQHMAYNNMAHHIKIKPTLQPWWTICFIPSPLISPSPNHILLCRRCLPHAIVTLYGRCKNNGENPWPLRDVTVFYSPLFSIKTLSHTPTRDAGYLRPQRRYSPAAAATSSRRYIWSEAVIRTVSYCWEFIISGDFHSPLFSIKSLSRTPTRDAGYLRPQRRYSPAVAATSSRHYIWSEAVKRTVSFSWELIILYDFYAPYRKWVFWSKRVRELRDRT